MPPRKRKRPVPSLPLIPSASTTAPNPTSVDYLSALPEDALCHLMSFLRIRDVVRLSCLNCRLRRAVALYLRLCRVISFQTNDFQSYLPSSISDEQLFTLLQKCPSLEQIYALNPKSIVRRHLRNDRQLLSIPGVITALSCCPNLKGVQTTHVSLFEAVLHQLPCLEILGGFKNYCASSPQAPENRFKLPHCPYLSFLELTGVEIPELPTMHHLRHLHLHFVHFSKPLPFDQFSAPNLETFVTRHCSGPTSRVHFDPLVRALAEAPELSRLELVSVPSLQEIMHHAVQNGFQAGSFQQLRKLLIGACRGIHELDVGYLLLASADTLCNLSVQPSLSKDSFFASLAASEATFSEMKILNLGYTDEFPRKGLYGRVGLYNIGFGDIVEVHAPITDNGIRIIGSLFPTLQELTIYRCPHLMHPLVWKESGPNSWRHLTSLSLTRCHSIRLQEFLLFLDELRNLKELELDNVFRAPARGCSHVGLSAGTGLGFTAGVVANNHQEAAVDIEWQVANIQQPDDDDDLPPLPPMDLIYIDDMLDEDPNSGDESDADNKKAVKHEASHPPAEIQEPIAIPPNLAIKQEPPDNLDLLADPQPGCSNSTGGDGEKKHPKHSQHSYSLRRSCRQRETANSARKQRRFPANAESEYTGPITRQRHHYYYHHKVDVACQVTVEEVRSEMRRLSAASSNHSDGSSSSNIKTGNPERFTPSPIEVVWTSKRPNSDDKATSTGEPLLEDEYYQPMQLDCSSLESLAIIDCGISHLTIRRCSKLKHLHVEACSVLQRITLRHCPNLSTVELIQCPKLDLPAIVHNYSRLPACCDRAMYIQPYKTYDGVSVERTLLKDSLHSYGVALMVDNGPKVRRLTTPHYTTKLDGRLAFNRVLNVVSEINRYLVDNLEFQRSEHSLTHTVLPITNYPWGREIYSFSALATAKPVETTSDTEYTRLNTGGERSRRWLHVDMENHSRVPTDSPFMASYLDIRTDIPWIRELCSAGCHSDRLQGLFDSSMPKPLIETLIPHIRDVIAEQRCQRVSLPYHTAFVCVDLRYLRKSKTYLPSILDPEPSTHTADCVGSVLFL